MNKKRATYELRKESEFNEIVKKHKYVIVKVEVKDITNSGNFEDVNSFFKKTMNRISQ